MMTHFSLRTVKIMAALLGSAIILMGVFKIGVTVGYVKAGFSYNWGNNYHANFGAPAGTLRGLRDRDFMPAHGLSGEVIKLEGNIFIIRGRNDREELITTTRETRIKAGNATVRANDIGIGSKVVVIGEPTSDGRLNARFIRLLPLQER